MARIRGLEAGNKRESTGLSLGIKWVIGDRTVILKRSKVVVRCIGGSRFHIEFVKGKEHSDGLAF